MTTDNRIPEAIYTKAGFLLNDERYDELVRLSRYGFVSLSWSGRPTQPWRYAIIQLKHRDSDLREQVNYDRLVDVYGKNDQLLPPIRFETFDDYLHGWAAVAVVELWNEAGVVSTETLRFLDMLRSIHTDGCLDEDELSRREHQSQIDKVLSIANGILNSPLETPETVLSWIAKKYPGAIESDWFSDTQVAEALFYLRIADVYELSDVYVRLSNARRQLSYDEHAFMQAFRREWHGEVSWIIEQLHETIPINALLRKGDGYLNPGEILERIDEKVVELNTILDRGAQLKRHQVQATTELRDSLMEVSRKLTNLQVFMYYDS